MGEILGVSELGENGGEDRGNIWCVSGRGNRGRVGDIFGVSEGGGRGVRVGEILGVSEGE